MNSVKGPTCCFWMSAALVRRLLPLSVAVGAVIILAGGFYIHRVQEYQSLSIGDWAFAVHEGQVRLVERRWEAEVQKAFRRWEPSAPTLRFRDGEYLVYDLTGKQPRVLLAKDKGPHAEWVFEIVEKLVPSVRNRSAGIREGDEGYIVLLSASNGPFKGWYVGEGELTMAESARSRTEPVWKPLVLVKGWKQAARIRFLAKQHYVESRDRR